MQKLKTTSKFEILTPDGFQPFDGISCSVKDKILVIGYNNKTLKCSTDHKIQTSKGFVQASNLSCDDELITKTGKNKITSIELQYGVFSLFDPINVGSKKEYYSNDIVSHNCTFLGTGDTYIDGETLTLLNDNENREYWISYNNRMRIWKEAESHFHYVIGVDVSLGRERDYSAFHVINAYDGEQVVEFYSNKTPLDEFAEIVAKTGKAYNNALIIPERNTIGLNLIENLIKKLEYENVYMDKNNLFGFQTTQQSKAFILGVMEEYVRTRKVSLNSERTVKELLTFIIDESGKPVADEGQHDDLVMSLALCCFGLKYLLESSMSIISKLNGSNLYDPLTVSKGVDSKSKRAEWGGKSWDEIKWVLGK